MDKLLLTGLAALAGLSNPIQSAANAELQKATGSPVVTALLVYGVALAGLLLLAPFFGVPARGLGARLAGLPWWAWVGGLCHLLFVIAGATATKPIGSGTFTVTVLVCAVLLSIALDSSGALGLEQRPVTVLRVVGGVVAIGGVVLVAIG